MIYRNEHRAHIDPANPLTNTPQYNVTIQPAPVGMAWRAVYVYHLSPHENGNQHNIFLDVLRVDGEWGDADRLRIGWTWEGRRPNEGAPPRPFEKRPPECRGQLDLYKGQKLSCWILDEHYPSDTVAGLRSDVQDVPGNNLFHNSFVVLFQLQQAGTVPPVDPSPDISAQLAALSRLVAGQRQDLIRLTEANATMAAILAEIAEAK